MSSNMTKEIAIQISDNENNACSRNRNAVTAPSAGAQDMEYSSKAPAASTTHIPSKELMKLTYSKVNSQQVIPISLPLPSPLLSPSSLVPSPPPPKSYKATTYVPILPRPQTALRINSNAAENNTHQLGPVDMTFSRSYHRGNGPNHPFGLTPNSRSYGGGSGLTHPFGIRFSQSYGWGSGAVQPNRVTFPSPFARAGNRAALQPGGAIFSPHNVTNNYRFHPYMMRNMDLPYVANENSDSTLRTIDFLSQMEAGSAEQMQGRRMLNPPHEMLVNWGSMLTLGNGRRRSVDLNLRIRLG